MSDTTINFIEIYYFVRKGRSRVFSRVFSFLAGLTTIRAHKCQSTFQRMFDQCQDVYNSACYISLAAIRWFGLWTDCVVVIYIGCVTYTCVALRESILYYLI